MEKMESHTSSESGSMVDFFQFIPQRDLENRLL